jgi:hypothetical protein
MCSDFVTRSHFERRVPPGRHDLAFKVAFGSDAKAARAFKVRRMTVWRWRHTPHIPDWVADILSDLVHQKIAEAHEAEQQLRWYRQEPPKPPRRLSGCCAGYVRKHKRTPRTAEQRTAFGH